MLAERRVEMSYKGYLAFRNTKGIEWSGHNEVTTKIDAGPLHRPRNDASGWVNRGWNPLWL